jgi:taurine transport system substrate-binding protein
MKLILSILVVAMSMAFSEGAIAASKPDKVVVCYLSLVNSQLVTKNQKYHEAEMGVPVEWVRFSSGGKVNTAMASGSCDFGNLGLPPSTIGLASGLKYWGIYNANVLGAVEGMAGQKSIKSIADLAGKTVVAPFGSTTHYLLMQAITDAGLDPKKDKIKILDMSPASALASYIRGDVHAAWIWEPSLNKIIDNNGHMIKHSGDMGAEGYITWDVISVSSSFAKKYPDIVKKFVKSELKATDFWYRNPDETAKIVQEELGGITVADAARMIRGTILLDISGQLSPDMLGTSKKKGRHAEQVVAVSKFLKSQKRIKKEVTLEQARAWLHPEFLEAVHAEMWGTK